MQIEKEKQNNQQKDCTSIIMPDTTKNSRQPYPEESKFGGGSDDDTVMYVIGFCGALLGILLSGLWLALPITQLVMQNMYADQMDCKSFVPPRTWLIVEGVTSIVNVALLFFIIAGALTQKKVLILAAGIASIPSIFLSMFKFAWLIVGSVMFWRDCSNMNPTQINTLMWCSLIIGYVSLAFGICGRKSTQKNDDEK
ncbi:hypothetical protein BMW23_1049 [Bodo saltans virus]|jgi:hypothetical protein|uniref:Transmembrane protein n=1 Tax=Bodo saltans virus TaxID=2024608 RepID=A0A2H4UVY4_9VIRU|nr:hypothetical protein QJ851_gp1030 [Bodo saltans virus]ATZ81093.1 hypothetical protein BMW23_1049 [Bodo saltans virus]